MEAQARERYGDRISVSHWDMERTDRAICESQTTGFIKIIHHAEKVLGVTIVGEQAGEQINEFTLALRRGLSLPDLAGIMHVYPTYSTGIQQLAAQITTEHLLSGVSGRIIKVLARRNR